MRHNQMLKIQRPICDPWIEFQCICVNQKNIHSKSNFNF